MWLFPWRLLSSRRVLLLARLLWLEEEPPLLGGGGERDADRDRPRSTSKEAVREPCCIYIYICRWGCESADRLINATNAKQLTYGRTLTAAATGAACGSDAPASTKSS